MEIIIPSGDHWPRLSTRFPLETVPLSLTVYTPGGYHLNLCDSIIRARYRDGYQRGELMKPGKVYQAQIALPPISNLFKAEHRFRLDIANSNFPRFDVNPNTGDPVGTHTTPALNTVYVDSTRPSQIVLQLIPR